MAERAKVIQSYVNNGIMESFYLQAHKLHVNVILLGTFI